MLFLLLSIGGTALAGGGAYVWKRRQKTVPKGASPPAPSPSAAPPVATGAKAPSLGAAAAAAAAGGLVADELQSQFFDPNHDHPFTDAAAPLIGAGVGGGAFALVGPQAVVLIPCVVIIAEFLALANIIEEAARVAQFDAIAKHIGELADAGKGMEAWNYAAQEWPKVGKRGPPFRDRGLLGVTNITTADGRSIDIRATLDAAYADAKEIVSRVPKAKGPDGRLYAATNAYLKDPKYVRSRQLGDAWADAFEGKGLPIGSGPIPWLLPGALHQYVLELTYAEANADKLDDAKPPAHGAKAPPKKKPPKATTPAPPPPASHGASAPGHPSAPPPEVPSSTGAPPPASSASTSHVQHHTASHTGSDE